MDRKQNRGHYSLGPVINTINTKLERWKKTHPSLNGRKITTQMIIGGHTQFLTQAQGMPNDIEDILSKILKDFMWDDDSSPCIANKTLTKPITMGGLDLLDLEARNDAINIMWLKAYLNFSPTRPEWALITDLIVEKSVPKCMVKKAIINPFLQRWSAPTMLCSRLGAR